MLSLGPCKTLSQCFSLVDVKEILINAHVLTHRFLEFHSYLNVISAEKRDRFCQGGIIQDVCV